MRGIHCFFSKPIVLGRDVSGIHHRQHDVQKLLPNYAIYTMVLSALQWRKTNGDIKLYCDSHSYQYFKQLGALSCWNEVEIISENITSLNIDLKTFWSASKFFAYQKETKPFACIDTDLIVWNKVDFQTNLDWQFAHWEEVNFTSKSYPAVEKLSIPENYKFPAHANEIKLAANMCITVFHNMEFCTRFTNEVFRYMVDNKVLHNMELHASPEILYMEQRLPLLLSKQYGYSCAPVLDAVWSPQLFKFITDDGKYGAWRFNQLNDKSPFTHLWFYKKYVEENPLAKFKLEQDLYKELENRFPEELCKLKL